ncbi:MAG: PaaI family thioesterase [Solirubrobacteraceae bacterium]
MPSGETPISLPEDFVPAIALADCFDALYGLELLELAPEGDVARGRVRVRDELRRHDGLLHGGVISTLAETLASWGTWRVVGGPGTAVMGSSNDTRFLRPLTDGHANAVGRTRHRGRTRWLWDVHTRDDDGRLCAVTTVNITIRPAR